MFTLTELVKAASVSLFGFEDNGERRADAGLSPQASHTLWGALGGWAAQGSLTEMQLSTQLQKFSRDSSDSLYMAARTSEKTQRSGSPRLRSSYV